MGGHPTAMCDQVLPPAIEAPCSDYIKKHKFTKMPCWFHRIDKVESSNPSDNSKQESQFRKGNRHFFHEISPTSDLFCLSNNVNINSQMGHGLDELSWYCHIH